MIQNPNCAAVYGGQLVHVKLPRHAHVEDVKRAIFTQLNCEQGADIALFLARDSCGTWLTEEHPEYQQFKYGNHVIPHRIEAMTSNYMCDDTLLSTIPFPKRGRGYIDVLFEVSGYGPIQPRYKPEDKHCGPASCAVFLCAGLATAAIIPHLHFVAAVIASALITGVVTEGALILSDPLLVDCVCCGETKPSVSRMTNFCAPLIFTFLPDLVNNI